MSNTRVPELFSRDDMLLASYETGELPENVKAVAVKPRTSSLADCDRKLAYLMENVDATNSPAENHGVNGASDGRLTAEMGRAAEAVSVAAINAIPGVHVIHNDPQIALPDDFPISGHPDGELCFCDDGEHVDYRHPETAMVYGFEHKYLGRYKYREIISKGLEVAAPDYIQQVVTYGMALGWDAVCFVVVAQDASGIRGEYRIDKKRKYQWTKDVDAREDGWNPKVDITWLDIRGYKIAIGPQILRRAADVVEQLGPHVPGDIIRSYDPAKAKFPCSLWCEWRDRCIEDGEGTVPLLPPPLGRA
jgi:hypothetical protein